MRSTAFDNRRVVKQHTFIYLPGVAGNHRGAIFQGLADAVVRLSHSSRPKDYDEPAGHRLEIQVLGAVENLLAVLVVIFLLFRIIVVGASGLVG